MKVVLLCAGYATRLYPLTENQPKPLLPVGGRPILEWILERVSKVEEVESVYLVSNDKFAGHFETWAKHAQYPWPVDVINDRTSSNETRLGAIGDLAFVIRARNLEPDDLMVIAGDNFFDFDLASFVKYGNKVRPHGVIAVYDVKDKELAKRYGLVRTREDGRVVEFQEKPEEPQTTLASSGIYWLPKEIWGFLDTYIKGGHNTDQPGHYMRWLAEKSGLYAFPLEGKWLDIGDLASYQKANDIVN
ncbi:MAG: Glucose-1-phosphate adenylyltransferase [Candidatus Omnitrophica bacterium ADurb.Bin292]|nr:MAG: Glucose-1-phosphate adenylyltransferase [Candidatus Omnitrophica bacterium ADurb.Bin292]HPW76310.1 nucleotidyltransferase family protein [Candidatus Omnitrophota bacterium]HQB11937.1 nucleotidyltransferase family protein [Candidatus Omnitrophota bacterium]